MARSIIYNNVVSGEAFRPRQIFVFGGFALRAKSIGHLEQIDSYAPGHQISFGNLNYVTDIRGDLMMRSILRSSRCALRLLPKIQVPTWLYLEHTPLDLR